MQMVRAGVTEFADYAEPSAAPFFVAEYDGTLKNANGDGHSSCV